MTLNTHLLNWSRLPAICAVAVLAAVLPSFGADSEFPDLPPTPPPTTSKYVLDLPPTVPAKPAVQASPVALSVAETNAAADTSTDISTNTPSVPIGTPLNGMDGLDDTYRLASGDTINYQVVEDEDDPKTLVITDSGDLEVPYLERFPARGKTCKELAKQLKVELEKKYYYQATVIISVYSKASQGVIYLVGGVRSPGPLEMPRDDVLTVSKAILRAGGFDDFADQSHVRITREAESGTNIVFTVNVAKILKQGRTKNDPQVQAGDLIYIPERTFNW